MFFFQAEEIAAAVRSRSTSNHIVSYHIKSYQPESKRSKVLDEVYLARSVRAP